MTPLAAGHTLLSYLNAHNSGSTDNKASTTDRASAGADVRVKAGVAAASKAALKAAGGSHQAAVAVHSLDKQRVSLASDLRSALAHSGVQLSGAVEFAVSSDGKVAVNASAADKAAMTAFLTSDTHRPSFAARIATQAKDALKVSATIQQSAAISQAARYGGSSGGVISLYTSLMQEQSTNSAVFTFSAAASSLTYLGSLSTKA